MKEVIQLLLLIIPAIKDLLGGMDDEVSFGKKKRILKIMEDQDLTKTEKLERILFRKGKVKVEILGFVKDGIMKSSTLEKPIEEGVITNYRLVERYYEMADELRRVGDYE